MDIRNVAQSVDTDVLRAIAVKKTYFPGEKISANDLFISVRDVTYGMVAASLNRLQKQGKVAFDTGYENIMLV